MLASAGAAGEAIWLQVMRQALMCSVSHRVMTKYCVSMSSMRRALPTRILSQLTSGAHYHSSFASGASTRSSGIVPLSPELHSTRRVSTVSCTPWLSNAVQKLNFEPGHEAGDRAQVLAPSLVRTTFSEASFYPFHSHRAKCVLVIYVQH